MFYVVDADATLEDSFIFDYFPTIWEEDIVHVWRCKNQINNLVYGYGGVKLFPTILIRNATNWHIDFTTSVSNKFKPMPEVSNITTFNTDPFNTFKSGFRECCKLSAGAISRQDEATQNRLNIWCTTGKDKVYGEYAIAGAIKGREWGELYKNNVEMLDKINDYDFLQEEFEKWKNSLLEYTT